MGDVIQLGTGLTNAQIERVKAWARKELAEPTRRDDRSLCQDLAHLAGQIEAAAILLDARLSRYVEEGCSNEVEEIFRRLYRGAEDLMLKACNSPDNQIAQPRKRSRRSSRK